MRISLFQTTTFRLTVFASLAFIAAGCAMLGFLYFSMVSIIDGQIDAALSRECADLRAAFESGGYDRLRQFVSGRASREPDAERLYLLKGPNGALTGNIGRWPAAAPAPRTTADIEVSHAAVMARVRTFEFPGGVRLLAGRELTRRSNFQSLVRESLIGVLAVNLLLGLMAGVILARYARRRLGHINAAAQEVLEGDLSVRVPGRPEGDEYDLLAHNFNTMLERVEGLVTTVRGVTENVAHDLRTPLNRLRGKLEVALMSPRSPEEYRVVLGRSVADLEKIGATFNGILKIARIRAGALSLPGENIDITDIIAELLDLYEVFAEESGVTLESQFERKWLPRKITVKGDGHLITQAVANLLENAIKYSPPRGKVVISAATSPEGVSVTVADNGFGIPADKRAGILGRYVRLDQHGGKEGFGLGLNFVAAVAERHGAQLDLGDNMPGLRATLFFPAPANAEARPAAKRPLRVPAEQRGIAA
ncbi:MAG: HAMP domain-containing sensor histidine kinase [Rhodomicrobium sp.]